MKSTPRPGAPAKAGGGRTQPGRPATRSTTPAQRAANAARTQDFVRGVVAEMRRVTWPTRQEWVAATLLTIALVVGVGLFTAGCDYVFGLVFGWLSGGTR
ncbi:MAG TPA: preprotein translocase subunit SecE [Candidatus Elarobacter sp.]|jgi:preprotein translocase subunit SecE